jgi:hypothetical protein
MVRCIEKKYYKKKLISFIHDQGLALETTPSDFDSEVADDLDIAFRAFTQVLTSWIQPLQTFQPPLKLRIFPYRTNFNKVLGKQKKLPVMSAKKTKPIGFCYLVAMHYVVHVLQESIRFIQKNKIHYIYPEGIEDGFSIYRFHPFVSLSLL